MRAVMRARPGFARCPRFPYTSPLGIPPQVRRANSGRDPFPLFLKRGKVYKQLDSYLNIDAPTTHTTQLIDRTGRVDPTTMETFNEADFAVGKEVLINGATFLIYGCDEFTRDYYQQVCVWVTTRVARAVVGGVRRSEGRGWTRWAEMAGPQLIPVLLHLPCHLPYVPHLPCSLIPLIPLTFPPSSPSFFPLRQVYSVLFDDIPVQFDEATERPQMVIPPHVAPGAEEDSLGSFLYLVGSPRS